MKKIDEKEMMNVSGGGWLLTIGKITAAILGTSFVTGILDGLIKLK